MTGKQANHRGLGSQFPTSTSHLQQDGIYFFQKSSSTPARISTQQAWLAWWVLAWVPSAWQACRRGQCLPFSTVSEGWGPPSAQENRQGRHLEHPCRNSLLLHNGPLRTCYRIFWNHSGSEKKGMFWGRKKGERGLEKEPHYGFLQYKLNFVPISAVVPQFMDHLRTKLPLKRVGTYFKRNALHMMPSGKEIPAVNSERILNRLLSLPQWGSPDKIVKSFVCLL